MRLQIDYHWQGLQLSLGPLVYHGTIIAMGPHGMAHLQWYIVMLGCPSETGGIHCIMCLKSGIETYSAHLSSEVKYLCHNVFELMYNRSAWPPIGKVLINDEVSMESFTARICQYPFYLFLCKLTTTDIPPSRLSSSGGKCLTGVLFTVTCTQGTS